MTLTSIDFNACPVPQPFTTGCCTIPTRWIPTSFSPAASCRTSASRYFRHGSLCLQFWQGSCLKFNKCGELAQAHAIETQLNFSQEWTGHERTQGTGLGIFIIRVEQLLDALSWTSTGVVHIITLISVANVWIPETIIMMGLGGSFHRPRLSLRAGVS